jgi:hypothetical protein
MPTISARMASGVSVAVSSAVSGAASIRRIQASSASRVTTVS